MTIGRRAFTGGALFLGGVGLMSSGSHALAMEAAQVAHRILAADKLGMLAEQVAKAVVLLHLNAEVERDLAQMQSAHDEFDDILLGFRSGEGNSGVVKERFFAVNKALKVVEELWAPFRIAVEEIIADGKVDDAHYHAIVDNDEALEKACHNVVRELEAAYGDVDIDMSLAMAIDTAGRQRSVAQKMCKEIALAAVGSEVDEHHKKFTKYSKRFGAVLDALIAGGNGMITFAKPPSKEAEAALIELRAHWEKVAPMVDTLNAVEQPPVADVLAFCHEVDDMTDETNQLAVLYENALK